MKRFVLFAFCLLLFCACNGKKDLSQTDEIFINLKDREASVVIQINDTAFYQNQDLFTGKVRVSDSEMSLMLINSNQSRIMIDLGGMDWYHKFPVERKVGDGPNDGTSVKIGKMVDVKNMIGEGYMLVEGTLSLQELTAEKVVLTLSGKVGKYSDFERPDRLYPMNGLVVFKKPEIEFQNITEREILKNQKVK